MGKLGVVIVGVGGAVASTVMAGVALMLRGAVPRIGMLTEAPAPGEHGLLDAITDFAKLEDLVFAGWDIKDRSVYESAIEHQVLPKEQLELVRAELEKIRPWPAIFSQEYAQNLEGKLVIKTQSFREQIKTVEKNIQDFKAQHGLDRVVMVNLASTESWVEPNGVHRSMAAFEQGLDTNNVAIAPSLRYLYAANRLGVPLANFTPGPKSPALEQHAIELGNCFAGSDGKTGQTLVKTALASMFRVRQLRIAGWYSVNFLGNNDGLALDSPSSNKAKVLSKSAVLDSIVGHKVENHQVHIHYYKPRGDAKEAWDNIDMIGFAGQPMQMKINFLCKDSILAAPLVLDLVRLLDVAKKRGERGVQKQLSLYFKAPYPVANEDVMHDLFRQEQMLLDWVAKVGKTPA